MKNKMTDYAGMTNDTPKNEAAQALGRMAKGKRKTLTEAERARRRETLARNRVARWKIVIPNPTTSPEVSGPVRIGLDGKAHLTPGQMEELISKRFPKS